MEKEKFEFIKPGQVRTRFAPSPTGFLHIGSARTALFNYLFAKKNEGVFVLRIEDTDKERSKPAFEKDIIENLKWLGIEEQEGPYKQSERKALYKKHIEKLLEQGKAYYCFCSLEELEVQKQEQMSRGEHPHYNGKCAKLSSKEVENNLKKGEKSVIRFKVPSKKVIFEDIIRGRVEFDAGLIGDIALAKNLETALYNLAVVIDDFEMKISHIIRGEDLLPSTPVQILLQQALKFPQPKYAHLPLILGPARNKLSKRHGAISIKEYKDQGYLPEALLNFLAFLGWNPGTEREIFSLPSLIKEFSLEKVQKGGAVFNIKRLDFLNGFYIRQKSLEKLTELCLPYLTQEGLIEPIFKTEQYPPAYGAMDISQVYKIPALSAQTGTGEEISFENLKKIISLYQERLKKLSEISELTDFFFKDKLDYAKELLRWKDMTDNEIKDSFDKLTELLSKIKEGQWRKDNLKNILMPEAEKIGPSISGAGDRGRLLWPLRVALTGKEASADPFEISEILGKEKTLKRLYEAREKLRS